ncbi:MAG TPA: type IX secretion system sortase PorU [Bacteroidia bacterium]|nr:type IX secretion system sortase PorU [Bacteroidia bacterium]
MIRFKNPENIKLTTAFFMVVSSIHVFGQIKPKTLPAQSKNTPPVLATNTNIVANKGTIALSWEVPRTDDFQGKGTIEYLYFKGAVLDQSKGNIPQYFRLIKLKNNTTQVKVNLVNPTYVPLTSEEIKVLGNSKQISADFNINSPVVTKSKEPYLSLTITPIRKNSVSNQFEKLVSFSLNIQQSSIEIASDKSAKRPDHSFATSSVLASGSWYKIGVTKDGIYKLDYNFFKSMGFDMSAPPKNIRVYGNGGAMLPTLNSAPRLDDLVENAIYVNGQGDSSFSTSDYILFYGQNPNIWTYDTNSADPCGRHYHHTVNLYTDTTYYFITTGSTPGKRITPESYLGTPTDTVRTFDDYAYHEADATNLISSGNIWFGEYFDVTTSYNIAFNFPNISTSSPAYVNVEVASRYDQSLGSSFYTIGTNSASTTITVPGVNTTIFFDTFAAIGAGCYTFTPTSSSLIVNVNKNTAGAIGWLYYVEANVRDNLTLSASQMEFRDAQSVKPGNVSVYDISSNQTLQVWDVTYPQNVKSLNVTVPKFGHNEFTYPSDTLRQFVTFTGSSFNTATFIGVVPNQNLHAFAQADMLIITSPAFWSQANQLAAFHRSHDSLTVCQVVTTTQVYNEFSSGRQDPIAIRDYARMFYDRATNYTTLPKYLLLFGDGSYDPKYRISGNTNYLLSYESDESLDPTGSYVSDDYYAILDNNEGSLDANNYGLDIGVGRIPADNQTQAQTVVNKIISYETNSGEPVIASTSCCTTQTNYNMGSWRNQVCFIAHDGDGDLHINEAEQLADSVNSQYHNLNINKIYLDAYQMIQTPGGPRYPSVNTAIDNQMDQGLLIINYTGHGGPLGLATSRVLDFSDIYAWTNTNLSLFFTASCSFAQYDDPLQISAGELCLVNSSAGNIGLMTTVREVYSGGNQTLNQNFFDSLYSPLPNGSLPRFGDLLNMAKNATGPILNCRMFTLIGDPAVRLAYPEERVYTTAINSMPVSAVADTLKAFAKVTITGYVGTTSAGLLSNFNGVLYPTIYDKPSLITTLDNLGGSNSPPLTFKLQKNTLFKGRASVNNGKFSFTFVVPKDIDYNIDYGKISYYAQDPTTQIDATGNYENVLVGGSLTTIPSGTAGPRVRLYMNDSTFVYGGLTDENPEIFALLSDSNGINITGNSIGHDITAVLDNNTQNTIDLNDYYKPALNSYQKGTLTYPLSSLTTGTHTLTLRVWNVFDNTTQANTEFVVQPTSSLQLQHVLNYPNPFTTHTQFFFEINDVCDMMNVQIQIFTVSGKLVKNIVTAVKLGSFRSDPIDWDGRDDFGDKIGNGVYIYHVRVRTSTGSTADSYQKLVIL